MSVPAVPRIAVRPYSVALPDGTACPMWRVDYVTAEGEWAVAEPAAGALTFTEQEAWCRSAILGRVSGLPIESIDFKPDGSIKPDHPAFYMQRRQQ